jgi:hypothetical protein
MLIHTEFMATPPNSWSLIDNERLSSFPWQDKQNDKLEDSLCYYIFLFNLR